MSDDYRLEVQNARHAHTATEVTLAGVVARLELGELGAASAELALTKQHEVEEAVAFLHQFADHSLNFLRRPATDLTEWRYSGNLDHGEIVTLIDSVLLDRQRNRDQAFESACKPNSKRMSANYENGMRSTGRNFRRRRRRMRRISRRSPAEAIGSTSGPPSSLRSPC